MARTTEEDRRATRTGAKAPALVAIGEPVSADPVAPPGHPPGSVKQLEQQLHGVIMRKVAAETQAAALDKEITVQKEKVATLTEQLKSTEGQLEGAYRANEDQAHSYDVKLRKKSRIISEQAASHETNKRKLEDAADELQDRATRARRDLRTIQNKKHDYEDHTDENMRLIERIAERSLPSRWADLDPSPIARDHACGFCQELMWKKDNTELCKTGCGHIFCRMCLIKFVAGSARRDGYAGRVACIQCGTALCMTHTD